MGEVYTKSYKVVGVTFTNDDGTSRQDILAEIVEQQNLGAPDPTFRFETGEYEGADSIAVYVDEKKVGFIEKNEVGWLIEHMDEAESIESFEVVGSGQDGYSLGLRLIVSFSKKDDSPKTESSSFVSLGSLKSPSELIEKKRQSKVVVCHNCGKETALEDVCQNCGAAVIRTGGGIFSENWAMLIGFAFLVGMFNKLGLELYIAQVSAALIIAYAAAAIFFAVLQLNINKQRLQQAHCAIIHERFKFRLWYILYGILGLSFALNLVFTI